MWRNGESRRISPIIGSGSGKAYRVDLRCVSGGSQSRKTQMEGVYFETGSRELYWCEISPLHSASLWSKRQCGIVSGWWLIVGRSHFDAYRDSSMALRMTSRGIGGY